MPPFDPHAEWLGNVQPQGLLVTVPALTKHGVVPNMDTRTLTELQARLSAWAAVPDTPAMLTSVFGWQPGDVLSGADVPDDLGVLLPETGHALRPDHAVPDPASTQGSPPWQLLIRDVPAGMDFDAPIPHGSWPASPHHLMTRLLQGTGIPTGLLVSPGAVRLIHLPPGEAAGHATFPIFEMLAVRGRPMLAALHMLLEEQRLFGDLDVQQDWLPAFENRGEGLFIQFDPVRVAEWLAQPAVQTRARQLEAGFAQWAAERQVERTFPGAAYIMVHTLAHLLLTAIAEECGYPASALRERVYALHPGQFGVLLYTATPGADGTLGGLAACAARTGALVQRAVALAELCSNDPICAYHAPDEAHGDRPLHGAACHGCVFIAETSCEQRNDLLDRSLIIDTLECAGAGFFPICGDTWPCRNHGAKSADLKTV